MMLICLLYILETGRKTLKLGVLPTTNLPQKLVEPPKFPERRQIIKTATKGKKTDHSLTKTLLTLPYKCLKGNLGKSGKWTYLRSAN